MTHSWCRLIEFGPFTKISHRPKILLSTIFGSFFVFREMSEEEKVEDVQEEPEDEVHEEEMNTEEVYDSISQARVKNS